MHFITFLTEDEYQSCDDIERHGNIFRSLDYSPIPLLDVNRFSYERLADLLLYIPKQHTIPVKVGHVTHTDTLPLVSVINNLCSYINDSEDSEAISVTGLITHSSILRNELRYKLIDDADCHKYSIGAYPVTCWQHYVTSNMQAIFSNGCPLAVEELKKSRIWGFINDYNVAASYGGISLPVYQLYKRQIITALKEGGVKVA